MAVVPLYLAKEVVLTVCPGVEALDQVLVGRLGMRRVKPIGRAVEANAFGVVC